MLGGAERSIIFQAKELSKNYKVNFIVPLPSSPEIEELIKTEHPISKIEFVKLPSLLYSVSRFQIHNPFSIFFMFYTYLCFFIKNLSNKELINADIFWANGNKVAAFFFPLALLLNKRFVWHFRDYPHVKGFIGVLFSLIKFCLRDNDLLLGNSYSVTKALIQVFKKEKQTFCWYNPVGELNFLRKSSPVKNISVLSMLANWKGQHEVIFWAALYKHELQKLGIEKINLYGDMIYLTKGTHQDYPSALTKLVKKFNLENFVQFCGKTSPELAFRETDILIHSSIKPEPFGRVLVEAFAVKVALISTAIGGAKELVQGSQSSQYTPQDYQGLFSEVEKLTNLPFYDEKVGCASRYLKELEAIFFKQFDDICKMID